MRHGGSIPGTIELGGPSAATDLRTEREVSVIETRQILEELELKGVLATSATGAVFLAADPESGRDVVIKTVSCAVPGVEDQVRELFLAMVEAARSVTVQAMPRLRDHGLSPEGDGFLVMDLIDGVPLDETSQLTPFAAINILLDVLSCIEDLASVGVAHLNLVPGNVFLTNPPAHDRAMVLGFGSGATLAHAATGVPGDERRPYLAPELVAGDIPAADQRWRSDLYAFGVIACGVLGAEIRADGYDRPTVVLPAAVRDELPEAEPLEEMLATVMDPDPMRRGDSPSQVRDPLIRALPDPSPTAAGTKATAADQPSWDPNKTDPAGVVSPLPVSSQRHREQISSEATVAVTSDGRAAEDDWPAVLFDDAEPPPSPADPDDTDVRNPIPEDVWVPPDEQPEDAAPEAIPETSPAARSGRRVSRAELVLVSSVVVVLLVVLVSTWPNGDEQPLPVETGAVVADVETEATLVPPPEDGNLFDDLLRVQKLVDAGELDAAAAELDRLDDRVASSSSSDQRALFDSLVSAVAQAADRDAAIADLRNGLAHGSIKMLRRGVAALDGVPRVEIDEVPGLGDDLRRARRALKLHGQLWTAYRNGDHLSAIGIAAELSRALPGYSGASDLREQSAAALETRAEALITEHRYGDAVKVFEGLLGAWPGRRGVAERIAWCREQIERSRREEAQIANALAMGDRGDPEAGLAALDAMEPAPRFHDDVEAARKALEQRLAELDQAPPTVEIAADVELAFKKNATITIPLKIEDDHRVERVVVHARSEVDDDYLQIPLAVADDGLYHFTITPDLHSNKDVFFFVVAKDVSGHVGRLGTAEEPRKVQRRKWFKKVG